MPVANPNILERSVSNSATGYYAEDCTDPDFFIEGNVQEDGGEFVLTFIVLAVKRDPGGIARRGAIRGSEFFEAMWQHFAAAGTRIDAIQAEWTAAPLSAIASFTTNLDAFNAAIHRFPTLEIAALHGTPTGKYAASRGYSRVNIVRALPLGGMPYNEVVVRFRRP